MSVIDFTTRNVIRKWQVPGKASPDMGGVSADGKVLWLSGRFNSEVYAIDTSDGKLLARIPWAVNRTGCASTRSPAVIRSGIQGSFAERLPCNVTKVKMAVQVQSPERPSSV